MSEATSGRVAIVTGANRGIGVGEQDHDANLQKKGSIFGRLTPVPCERSGVRGQRVLAAARPGSRRDCRRDWYACWLPVFTTRA